MKKIDDETKAPAVKLYSIEHFILKMFELKIGFIVVDDRVILNKDQFTRVLTECKGYINNLLISSEYGSHVIQSPLPF